jgi:hypothetical protein
MAPYEAAGSFSGQSEKTDFGDFKAKAMKT